MKLLRFQAKNIFSLGEIDVNLADRGLILVTGHSLDEGSSNGSGKSSIANKGILWTLYGSTAGGLKADDVLNRHGSTKSGWGTIEFVGVDGVKYKVHRGRPAKLELYREDVNISAKKASETQLLIDQALGLDYRSFLHTYMFGQGRLSSYASLPPAEQKAILEQILPIEQLSIWVDYTKDSLSKINESLQNVVTTISHYKIQINTYTDTLIDLRHKSSVWNVHKERRLQDVYKVLESHKELLASRDARLVMVNKELEKYENTDAEVKDTERALEQNMAELNDLASQLNVVNDRRNQWTATGISHSSKLVSLTDAKCPTCDRPIVDEQKLADIAANNEAHRIRIEEAHTHVKRCEELQKQLVALRENKLGLSDYLFAKKKDLEEKRKRLQYLKDQRSTLQGMKDDSKTYISMAENVAAEVDPVKDSIERMVQLKDDVLTKLVPLEKLKEKIEHEREYLVWWLKVYGTDIKNKMFENVCNFLDKQTNDYLKELKNPQLRVQFSTIKKLASGEVKEDFNVRVYSEKGGEGFDTLSGGEQQMVSFAIGKALGDLCKAQSSGSSDFQILDEPFSMLDPRNCENLIDFLSKEHGTIMLISNDENLMNLVPERLHVEKYKGVTTVAYGGN